MAIRSLDEFKSSPDARFSEGTWIVEYHDRTHLREGTYIRLGRIEIEECTPNGNCFFRFHPRCSEQLEKCINDAWNGVKGKHDPGKAAETIVDQLGESIVRLGLLQPRFEIEERKFITDRKFAIVILDTNALRNGAVRHLQEQFPETQIWIIIPTVILMEIGEKVANITSRDKDGFKTSHSALIRSRPQTTIAPQAVKWIRDQFPTETLELAPELLRAFRGYETRGNDAYKEPDRVSINDRLILEGIKDLRRQRNLSEGVYLMSGDKDMSRLARLEGIQTIYPEMPDIQSVSNGIYSIRYSLESKIHVVCSIHRFLWDLTHVFSKIRVKKCAKGLQKSEKLELFYYYPTKLVNDWVDDKLEVTGFGSSSTADAV
jgi:hypothetical protein